MTGGRAPRRSTARPRSRPAPPRPSAASLGAAARNAYAQLSQLRESRDALEGLQWTNAHADTDPIPGEMPKVDAEGQIVYDGARPVVPTYGERFAELDAADARLQERIDSRPGVRALVAKLERAQAERDRADVAEAEAEAATADEAP